MVWAKFGPCDGMDAEQAESSPSALHSTVVASEGGLACCQYSTPMYKIHIMMVWRLIELFFFLAEDEIFLP